jgi:hypothetical protein
MRIVMILVFLCLACADGNNDQMEADSAKAAAAIKLRFAQAKTATEMAERARSDSAVRTAKLKADSARAAMGVPSDAELSAMVRRLSPDSLDSVPKSVRTTLNERGCLVPQPFEGESKNAAVGAFTMKGAVEWAILCSVDGASQILFIDSKTGAVVDSLGQGSDTNWVQGIGDGKWGFSLALATFPNKAIGHRLMDDDGKAIPQPIDHDALDVGFLEKASVAHYRANGNWYRVITSD